MLFSRGNKRIFEQAGRGRGIDKSRATQENRHMAQRIIVMISFVLLFGLGSYCNRGELRKFSTPRSIMFLHGGKASINVYSDPKKAEKPVGVITDSDDVSAIGYMHLAAATFLQIRCPESLRCDDGIGYVEKDIVAEKAKDVGPDSAAYLLDPGHEVFLSEKKMTRDWFFNPSNPLSKKTDAEMIAALIRNISDEDARTGRLIELSLLLSALTDPEKITDRRVALLKMRYRNLLSAPNSNKQMNESADEKTARNNLTSALTAAMQELAGENAQRYEEAGVSYMMEGFPFRSDSWNGLAIEFHRVSAIPYAQERILAASIKGADFAVDPPLADDAGTRAAEWQVEVKPLEGVFLKGKIVPASLTPGVQRDDEKSALREKTEGREKTEAKEKAKGGSDNIEVTSIRAEPSKNGLGFVLETNAGKVKLTPKEVPPYLTKGGPGLATFVQSIPANWQQIQKDNSFERAVMLTAMKFGHREEPSPRQKGNLVYKINLSDQQHYYWMMFNLVKKSPALKVEGEGWNGRWKEGYYPNMGANAIESWYQPKGVFIVQHRFIGGRGGNSALTESRCFSEGMGSFTVLIPPSDVHKDKPDVTLLLRDDDEAAWDPCSVAVRSLNARKDN